MNGSFRKSARGAGLSPPAIMWRAVSARSQSERSSCSPPRQHHSAAPDSTELRDTSPAGAQRHDSTVFFSESDALCKFYFIFHLKSVALFVSFPPRCVLRGGSVSDSLYIQISALSCFCALIKTVGSFCPIGENF